MKKLQVLILLLECFFIQASQVNNAILSVNNNKQAFIHQESVANALVSLKTINLPQQLSTTKYSPESLQKNEETRENQELSMQKMKDNTENKTKIEKAREAGRAASLEARYKGMDCKKAYNKAYTAILYKKDGTTKKISKNTAHIKRKYVKKSSQILEKTREDRHLTIQNRQNKYCPKSLQILAQAQETRSLVFEKLKENPEFMRRLQNAQKLAQYASLQAQEIGSNRQNAYNKTYKKECYKIPEYKKVYDDYEKIYNQLPENKIRKNQLTRNMRAARKNQVNIADSNIMSNFNLNTLPDKMDTHIFVDSNELDRCSIKPFDANNINDSNESEDCCYDGSLYCNSFDDVHSDTSSDYYNNYSFRNDIQASSSSNTITNNYETSSLTNQNETLQELEDDFNLEGLEDNFDFIFNNDTHE